MRRQNYAMSINTWYHYMVSIHGINTWYHYMVSMRGIATWYRYMVSLHSITTWYHYRVSLHGINWGGDVECGEVGTLLTWINNLELSHY